MPGLCTAALANFDSWHDRPGVSVALLEFIFSGANNELGRTTMLCGLSIGSPGLLRGEFHPAPLPISRDMKRSFGRHGTDVSWSACSGGGSQSRGRRVHEMGPSGVDLAPYRSNLVSLPASLDGSPNLADLLPPEVCVLLGGEQELVRRTKEETNALVDDGGVVKPHMDSALRHNKKRYLTFPRQLLSRGMLNFVERAKSCAGVFFVWKSSKTKLRCIIDATPGNMFFKVPPSVGLCSSETFSRIEIERGVFWPCDEKPIPPGLSQLRMALGLTDVAG